MGKFTQKQLHEIDLYKSETLAKYLRFCIHFEEIPREDQVLMIEGCTNVSAFRAAIEIYDNKISQYTK